MHIWNRRITMAMERRKIVLRPFKKTYEDLETLQTLWIKHFQFWITNKKMVPSNKKLLREWVSLEANF